MLRLSKLFFIDIVISTIFFIAAGVLFSQNTFAQLKINEFACFTTDDWIEVINTSDEPIDLSLFQLQDNTDSNSKDLEGVLNKDEYIVIEWNKLNKDTDSVIIKQKSDGTIIDKIDYGEEQLVLAPFSENQTIGRSPDGGDSIHIFASASKGSSNNDQEVYFTPTPTSTITPIPTRTPTPSKTPTPTKTPKPEPTTRSEVLSIIDSDTPSVEQSSTPQEKISSIGAVPTAVLGNSSEYGEEEETEPDVAVASEYSNMKGSASIVASGIIFLCACGILLYRKYRQ